MFNCFCSTVGAKLPTRGSPNAAGFDLYADLGLQEVVIQPGQRHRFSTGCILEIPTGYYGQIKPRSGLAARNGITVLGSVVDSDYRSVVDVLLLNTSTTESCTFRHGDRIAQLILIQHGTFAINQVNSASDLSTTDRGTGGFGSTGK